MVNRNKAHRIASLVNKRIKEWETGAPIYVNKDLLKEGPGRPGPVITISRQHGCNGSAFAQVLSEQLGFTTFDAEIVEMIANDSHASSRSVATLDEKGRSELSVLLDEAIGYPGLSSVSYFRSLKRVLYTIALHGNAIIIGRGAGMLLPPHKRIALRLVAPLKDRVKHIIAMNECTEKRALSEITKTEHERAQFVSKYFKKNIDDSSLYDAVINTAVVKPDGIVEIVKTIHDHHAPIHGRAENKPLVTV